VTRFFGGPFEPAYRALPPHELESRSRRAIDALSHCTLCPRLCGADRTARADGFCGTGRHARVCSVFPHHGEEDCLRGRHGSGTIFIGHCNLRCAFCQNADISQRAAGPEMTAHDIAEEMLALQVAGCHNINLVSPSHVTAQVLEALAVAVPRGLRLPIVYNTGGYDSVDTLRLFNGVVDIYMPDFKFWDPDTAERLCAAADYPQRAREAIAEMHRQVGALACGPDGIARRGVLVRHLVMPGMEDRSAAIFSWLANVLSPDTYVSIMEQYRPAHRVGREPAFDFINRRPTDVEFDAAVAAARAAGLHRFDGRDGL
jgi:putative pyruvate formate lyase activating enzyme